MPRQYSVGPPEPAEIDTIAAIGSWAFANSAPAEMLPWIERIGHENIRVVREGGAVAGNLGIIWMGQWFGGAAVPMAGIGAVGISPDRRGYGAASHLMREALAEIRRKGVPLSALYPATQPVYRSVGYEQAGSRFEIRLAAQPIDLKDRELELLPIADSDEAELHEVYTARARTTAGNLDRVAFSWGRIRKPKGDPPHGYKVTKDGRIEGYVYLTKQLRDRLKPDFTATDMAVLTPAAGRRLLTLFADHKSLANEFVAYSSPNDPTWTLLREQSFEARLLFNWMIRIVDVPKALESRGYPDAVSAEVHFAVTDPLFPENETPFTLEVADGRGRVKPGGRGSFKVHVRGLAPIYSGFLSPEAVQSAGLLDAPAAELRRAAPIFAGPAPWMPDMF